MNKKDSQNVSSPVPLLSPSPPPPTLRCSHASSSLHVPLHDVHCVIFRLVRRNNSRLSFVHADAFEPLHAEDFALRELYLSGCELTYLPEDLLPGKQNWADLEVVGEARGRRRPRARALACALCYKWSKVTRLHSDSTQDLNPYFQTLKIIRGRATATTNGC